MTRCPGPRPPGALKVIAVVVSFNRRDLVLEVLGAIAAQTRPPDHVVVVDNASGDGSARAVRSAFPQVEVIQLGRNVGGAGGFALGLSRSLDEGADAVWLLDDDAVPKPDALGALVRAWTSYDGAPPAAVASRVVWVDGTEHRMNIPRRRRGGSANQALRARAVGCEPIRSASFCSILLDGDAARQEAAPIADYFLWNDDFEYTARLLRRRTGLLAPASVVVHKTVDHYNSGSNPGPRFFYDVRNMVWMLGRSAALSPSERAFFAIVTSRRVVRTIARSANRATLVRQLLRGLRAGLVSGPRPTEEVLATVRR